MRLVVQGLCHAPARRLTLAIQWIVPAAVRVKWAMIANFVVHSLPKPDREPFGSRLQKVVLERGEVICEPGRQMTHAFMPINCILSVITIMHDGREVESRTIGRESGVGLLEAMGSRRAFERVIVQVPGECWKMPIDDLHRMAQESRTLAQCMIKHAQISLGQAVRGVACNALHSGEERLCKWLLLTQDRLDGDVVPLTQEHLSVMLGVQRTTVTALAQKLQDDGIIAYARGKIWLRSREHLLGRSCECYRILKTTADELLADPCD